MDPAGSGLPITLYLSLFAKSMQSDIQGNSNSCGWRELTIGTVNLGTVGHFELGIISGQAWFANVLASSMISAASARSLPKHRVRRCYNPTCWLNSVKSKQASSSSWRVIPPFSRADAMVAARLMNKEDRFILRTLHSPAFTKQLLGLTTTLPHSSKNVSVCQASSAVCSTNSRPEWTKLQLCVISRI